MGERWRGVFALGGGPARRRTCSPGCLPRRCGCRWILTARRKQANFGRLKGLLPRCQVMSPAAGVAEAACDARVRIARLLASASPRAGRTRHTPQRATP